MTEAVEQLLDRSADTLTRDELIALCESALVPEAKWTDRDSASAMAQVGHAYAWLKAGCAFRVIHSGNATNADDRCVSDRNTVWLDITAKGFAYHDHDGELTRETFYLPTANRLRKNEGRDWY